LGKFTFEELLISDVLFFKNINPKIESHIIRMVGLHQKKSKKQRESKSKREIKTKKRRKETKGLLLRKNP